MRIKALPIGSGPRNFYKKNIWATYVKKLRNTGLKFCS